MIYYPGQCFIYPNGTIVMIVDFETNSLSTVKVRAINSCKGDFSSQKRIGKPYTYQFWTSIRKLEKAKAKRIGTEEMLKALFKYKYGDRRCLK